MVFGPINSPTVLSARFNLTQFWNGRAKDLERTGWRPYSQSYQMGSNHELAVSVLQSIPEYVQWFSEVYGTGKMYEDENITIDQATDAIAAFEETLTTPNSRFDYWLKGYNEYISKMEKEGYDLFKDKGCIACHNGVGVGGNTYQKFGMAKNRMIKSLIPMADTT